MTIHFLNSKERKEVKEKLHEQFGIKEVPGVLAKIGQERIFIFQGDLTPENIAELEKEIPVERIGLYFAKIQDDGIRLSIDGAQILKSQITKNLFEISDEQVEEWMAGKELELSYGKREFIVITNNGDILGTGKASDTKITNFIPKSRRLKERD